MSAGSGGSPVSPGRSGSSGRWKSEPPQGTSPARWASCASSRRRSGVWSGRCTSMPREPPPAQPQDERRQRRRVHPQRRRVGEHGGAARVGHQPDRLLRAQPRVGDVRRAAVGRGSGRTRPGGRGRAPRPRAASATCGRPIGPAGPGDDVLKAHRAPPARRAADDALGARRARRPAARPAGRRGARAPPRGSSPAGAASPTGARTDSSTPGTTRTPRARAGLERLGHAVEGVVVGDREHADARRRRQLDQRRGRQRAVGGDGVGVEVGLRPGARRRPASPTRPLASRAAMTRAGALLRASRTRSGCARPGSPAPRTGRSRR